MNAPSNLLDAFRQCARFEAAGPSVGNLTLGRGRIGGAPVAAALVENRIASGSLGKAEIEAFVPFLVDVEKAKTPLVLFLDSAGARVSEGLHALGAYRALFRRVVKCAAAGAPLAALVGRNCYGGASMLAHVAGRRLFSPNSALAMSGPAILASGAGASVLDEAFRAITEAAIGAGARAKQSPDNTVWQPGEDPAAWLEAALAPVEKPWTALYLRHREIAARLEKAEAPKPPEPVRRNDLDRIFPDGYDVKDTGGLYTGKALRDGVESPVVGLVGRSTVGTDRAWRFAEAVWQLARTAPPRIDVLLDCEAHAPRLDDERRILTAYIDDMGFALGALASRGTAVDLTILGKAGGGVYVAVAGFATAVRTVHGASDIQVLPGAAVASILGESNDAIADIDEYRRAGVADAELRLGLVPPTLP